MIVDTEMRGGTGRGVAAIATYGETGTDLNVSVRRLSACALDASALLDQFDDVMLHQQGEVGELRRLLCQEVEKIPLRHQRNEFSVRRQTCGVGDRHHLSSER